MPENGAICIPSPARKRLPHQKPTLITITKDTTNSPFLQPIIVDGSRRVERRGGIIVLIDDKINFLTGYFSYNPLFHPLYHTGAGFLWKVAGINYVGFIVVERRYRY
jgi:hypothetical protein